MADGTGRGPKDPERREPEGLTALLEEWASDGSGYDEETLPDLKLALDRDRRASGDYRTIFGVGPDG